MPNNQTPAGKDQQQSARLLFNNSSLRAWQVRYKAEKAAQAAGEKNARKAPNA